MNIRIQSFHIDICTQKSVRNEQRYKKIMIKSFTCCQKLTHTIAIFSGLFYLLFGVGVGLVVAYCSA